MITKAQYCVGRHGDCPFFASRHCPGQRHGAACCDSVISFFLWIFLRFFTKKYALTHSRHLRQIPVQDRVVARSPDRMFSSLCIFFRIFS